jgi:hypothetical protein
MLKWGEKTPMRDRKTRNTKSLLPNANFPCATEKLLQDAVEKYYASLAGEELKEENDLELLLGAAASSVIFDSE